MWNSYFIHEDQNVKVMMGETPYKFNKDGTSTFSLTKTSQIFGSTWYLQKQCDLPQERDAMNATEHNR